MTTSKINPKLRTQTLTTCLILIMFCGIFSAVTVMSAAAQNTFSVRYEGNGATGGVDPVDSNTYTEGEVVVVLTNMGGLARGGYNFLGWAFSADALVPDFVVSNGTVVPSSFVMNASGVVLYGVWEMLGVVYGSVVFRQYDLIGGTVNQVLDTPLVFEAGSFIFLDGAPAVNYKFMGWLQNGTLVSMSQSYNFYVANEDTYVITAIFYDPLSKSEALDLMAVLAIALCAILIAFVLFAILWVRGRQHQYAEE